MHFSCTITFFIVPLHPISSRDGGIGRHEGLKKQQECHKGNFVSRTSLTNRNLE